MRNARQVWLAAGGLLAMGCVGLVAWSLRAAEPTVTGTVRIDNEPLPRGSIAFIPIDGTPGPGGGGEITSDGKYQIKSGLRPGKYRVEIRSSRSLPGRKVLNPTIPADLMDEEVSVIPERYNTRSELFCDVGPGSTVEDFNLNGAVAPR